MKSLLVYVKKANLLEGKLSSNSGFLVLEQSCWFLHFSWQQVLPIVCGSRQDVPPAWPRCSSVTPAQLSWWLLLANTLFKEKQAAEKAAFNSLSRFGWMSPRFHRNLSRVEARGLVVSSWSVLPWHHLPAALRESRFLFPLRRLNWVTSSVGNIQVFMALGVRFALVPSFLAF